MEGTKAMAVYQVPYSPCETGVPAVKAPAAVYPHDTDSPPTPTMFSIAITHDLRARNAMPNPDDNVANIPPEYKSLETDRPPDASATPLPEIVLCQGLSQCPPEYFAFFEGSACYCRLNTN